MDVVKMFNGIDPLVGCRSLHYSGPSTGFLRLRSLYLGSPQRFDLSQLIHLMYAKPFGVGDGGTVMCMAVLIAIQRGRAQREVQGGIWRSRPGRNARCRF